jgi:Ca2+-binding RTX toxin-like protein
MDRIFGYDEPAATGAAAGADDAAADTLLGGNGNDTITGNDGDTITGGSGNDVIRALGLDQTGQDAVIVTDFNPAQDTLILADRDGEDAVINDGENVVIRASTDGQDTEVVYRGRVIALLQDTDAAALSADRSWFGNIIALPAAPEVAGVASPPVPEAEAASSSDTASAAG